MARDVLESIHPHPTLSETVMESAGNGLRRGHARRQASEGGEVKTERFHHKDTKITQRTTKKAEDKSEFRRGREGNKVVSTGSSSLCSLLSSTFFCLLLWLFV